MGAGAAEVTGEKGEPIGEKFRGDSEFIGVVIEKEGIVLPSSLVVGHGGGVNSVN